MHHLLGFTVSIGQTANTELTALDDQIITRTANGRYMLPQDMLLLAAYAGSATMLRARLNSSSLRQINPRYVLPVEVGAAPTDVPLFESLVDNPFQLKAFEEMVYEATSGLACGNEQAHGLLWIAANLQQAPLGDVYNCRITSSTAAVANVWTSLTFTMETSLPPGTYALVGSDLVGAGGIAHRWLIPNQLWRPGALCRAAIGDAPGDIFVRRRLGEWGRFPNTALPGLQVLCNTTTAAWAGFMALVKVA